MLFHCFHSRFSRGKECHWSVFEECILFPGSDQNAKGRFLLFPFPLSKNQGMAFAESGRFHSSLPKTQEWFLIKQSFSTPALQNSGNGFHSNKLPPPSAPNDGLNDYCDLPGQLAMPLRRTPRSVNSRCRRKATPSEGSTYRSEPVERSRMCPREGERSPRAYGEEQGAAQSYAPPGDERAYGGQEQGAAQVCVH